MKTRKLSAKEKLDIATMMYFIPSTAKARIYPNDKIKMANLSSRGIKPDRETKGFTLLKWGKTYRDEQITSYKRDIQLGLFTKAELLESIPPRFRDWLWSKIEHVPYDIDAYELQYREGKPHYTLSDKPSTTKMFITLHQRGEI